MAVGAKAEVPDGLTGVLGAAEDQGVAASGGTESKLVQSDGLTTGGEDAGAGSSGEAESRNRDLGDGQETVVVGDSADNDDGPLLVLGNVGGNAGQRHRGTVDLGHKEAAEDDLVEGSVSAACEHKSWSVKLLFVSFLLSLFRSWGVFSRIRRTRQEAVQLHEKLEVHIVARGSLAVRALHVVAVEIDT